MRAGRRDDRTHPRHRRDHDRRHHRDGHRRHRRHGTGHRPEHRRHRDRHRHRDGSHRHRHRGRPPPPPGPPPPPPGPPAADRRDHPDRRRGPPGPPPDRRDDRRRPDAGGHHAGVRTRGHVARRRPRATAARVTTTGTLRPDAARAARGRWAAGLRRVTALRGRHHPGRPWPRGWPRPRTGPRTGRLNRRRTGCCRHAACADRDAAAASAAATTDGVVGDPRRCAGAGLGPADRGCRCRIHRRPDGRSGACGPGFGAPVPLRCGSRRGSARGLLAPGGPGRGPGRRSSRRIAGASPPPPVRPRAPEPPGRPAPADAGRAAGAAAGGRAAAARRRTGRASVRRDRTGCRRRRGRGGPGTAPPGRGAPVRCGARGPARHRRAGRARDRVRRGADAMPPLRAAAGHRLAQPARDGGLDGGRRGLHVLAEVLQLAQDLLAADAELLRELVHAGLACHCTPCLLGGRAAVPLDLEPSVEARSWCDLHDWLMTGRPVLSSVGGSGVPGPQVCVPDPAGDPLRAAQTGPHLDRRPAGPGRAAPAGTPSDARPGRGTPGRGATTHPVPGAAAAGPG